MVDDEPLIVESLQRMLRRDHDVTSCTSPTEALAMILGGARFDAILCDLMMPKLTGRHVYETLFRYCGGQAERIVFITGGATVEAHAEFLRQVRNPCVLKPFRVDEILDVVRKVVG